MSYWTAFCGVMCAAVAAIWLVVLAINFMIIVTEDRIKMNFVWFTVSLVAACAFLAGAIVIFEGAKIS